MPCIISSFAGMIRIPNLSDTPVALKRNDHFCQLNSVFNPSKADEQLRPIPIPTRPTPKEKCFSSSINLDPAHLLPNNVFAKFGNLHNSIQCSTPRLKVTMVLQASSKPK